MGLNDIVLLIGGNEGDRMKLISQATELIEQHIGSVVASSALYETEAWGFESATPFLNQALRIVTPLSPTAVLEQGQAIERMLGRVAVVSPDGEKHYSSRPMDVDIIFFNSEIIDTPRLEIPHPRMHLRKFVLHPLCDIIPDFVHPTLGKTVSQLLFECKDECRIIKKC